MFGKEEPNSITTKSRSILTTRVATNDRFSHVMIYAFNHSVDIVSGSNDFHEDDEEYDEDDDYYADGDDDDDGSDDIADCFTMNEDDGADNDDNSDDADDYG